MVKRESARRLWDRRAASYDSQGDRMERLTIGDSREWICARARGRTLEVGVGTGRNLSWYDKSVDLTGIDLSPNMLAAARRRAGTLGRQVELREGEAEHLPFPDATFDTVVCTLAVCTVADRNAALAEMRRVLRPGGRLLLLDHAERRWVRGRPADLALRHGFVAESRSRLRLGLIERLSARKPG
ncbi:class I SAM-dependent methyltransferase [Plantactinospora endophytica]|uniref:Ubiquinone/menaquinone biosynthesis methyltransferase n=1 Tax=Plantactinospora endophytica TaxID=673535 RepID=A0ABQ4DXY2_9ACTN|nr:class I SAM-dependent methyltransferase [Plantactinospora endophytica]GIG87309.1 ubiquinone/menaquinone biosynthesis methyltransferase [Plantactinospora endophytica]